MFQIIIGCLIANVLTVLISYFLIKKYINKNKDAFNNILNDIKAKYEGIDELFNGFDEIKSAIENIKNKIDKLPF